MAKFILEHTHTNEVNTNTNTGGGGSKTNEVGGGSSTKGGGSSTKGGGSGTKGGGRGTKGGRSSTKGGGSSTKGGGGANTKKGEKKKGTRKSTTSKKGGASVNDGTPAYTSEPLIILEDRSQTKFKGPSATRSFFAKFHQGYKSRFTRGTRAGTEAYQLIEPASIGFPETSIICRFVDSRYKIYDQGVVWSSINAASRDLKVNLHSIPVNQHSKKSPPASGTSSHDVLGDADIIFEQSRAHMKAINPMDGSEEDVSLRMSFNERVKEQRWKEEQRQLSLAGGSFSAPKTKRRKFTKGQSASEPLAVDLSSPTFDDISSSSTPPKSALTDRMSANAELSDAEIVPDPIHEKKKNEKSGKSDSRSNRVQRTGPLNERGESEAMVKKRSKTGKGMKGGVEDVGVADVGVADVGVSAGAVATGKNGKNGKKGKKGKYYLDPESLRFRVGDKVQCRIGSDPVTGWGNGTVTQLFYRKNKWAPGQVAPYKISLEDGTNIFAPQDIPDVIRKPPS
ncbi:hypothetical protein TrCOL_g64 [Triparma columacea]|uniref:Uncharacterized protein n=1 Tax=Triparma columacea TaxID=722753 RepID=A0A9W7L9M9_9STRA|nr:hypothetical protein TrCOL_g64 [Triparma columacea]